MLPLLLLIAESGNETGEVFTNCVWPYFVGVAGIVVTGMLFAVARARHEIGTPICCAAFAGWLALCTLANGGILILGPLEPSLFVLTTGLLGLPFAPLAAAPLALSRIRHR